MADYHAKWAEKIKTEHPEVSEQNVDNLVKAQVGESLLARVLEDAGVLKRDQKARSICGDLLNL